MRARLPLRRAAFVQPTLIVLRRSVRKKRFRTVKKTNPFPGRDAVGSTGAEQLFLARLRGRTSAARFRVQHAGGLCPPLLRTTTAPSVKMHGDPAVMRRRRGRRVQVGDHGGIIMMALHQTTGPTDEVYFSLKSGACWYTVQLAEAINVQNIRCIPPTPFNSPITPAPPPLSLHRSQGTGASP